MWIALARAYHECRGGDRYNTILSGVLSSVKEGEAIFPLSAAHLIETRKKLNLPQRTRLAQVMVEVSQGWTLAPTGYLTPVELEIAIAHLFGQVPPDPPEALGRGIPFAFGESEELQDDLDISKERAQLLQAVLDTPKGLAALLVGLDESLNVRGVRDFEHQATLFAKRVEETRRIGKNFSKAMRKRAYAADLTLHLQAELEQLLSKYRRGLDDFPNIGTSSLMAFFERVPTLDIEIELATERDEHWDKPIDPNDMIDVSILSIAIPYCNIVVTERFWAHLAKRKGLDEKYDTIILCDLMELEGCLE